MKLETIYNMSDEEWKENIENNTKETMCLIDIFSFLVRIKNESKYKHSEEKETRIKLKTYLLKYYESFDIGILEEMENEKYLKEFPKQSDKIIKLNLKALSDLVSRVMGCNCNFNYAGKKGEE